MPSGNQEVYSVTEGDYEIPDNNAWQVVGRRMTVFSDGLIVDVRVERRGDVFRTTFNLPALYLLVTPGCQARLQQGDPFLER